MDTYTSAEHMVVILSATDSGQSKEFKPVDDGRHGHQTQAGMYQGPVQRQVHLGVLLLFLSMALLSFCSLLLPSAPFCSLLLPSVLIPLLPAKEGKNSQRELPTLHGPSQLFTRSVWED